MRYLQVFTFLTILIFDTACKGPVKKDLPKEKEHPKLIITIGNPKYGNVQCGLQDKVGNLWFGTGQNGLYKYDGKSFSRFLVADGLNSNNISAILEDKDGKIWIGTEAGLCVYDGKTIAKIQILLPKNHPRHNYSDSSSHWVFSIMQAKSGKLWFATIDGVYIYDGKSFTPFIIDSGAMGYLSSNNNAEHILEDKAGNIWFGGRGNHGVYRYDGKSVINIKLEELYTFFRSDTIRTGHDWAWPQLQDKDGNIWFSNWAGVYRYDPSASLSTGTPSFTSFTKNDGLAIGAITRIIENKNGNLLFGGADGLCRYDGKSFTCFKDGLINPWIWSLLEDKTGNLWVGTRENGLYLFDGKTFINYSEYKK